MEKNPVKFLKRITQEKLEKAQVQLRNSTQRYNSLMSNLNSMERQLNAAMIEFRQIDGEMKSRIRQVYKHQRHGMFELFLSANDVNSLMDILYFQKLVIQNDYKRMQSVRAKANEIAA